jgi:hypothetical protein
LRLLMNARARALLTRATEGVCTRRDGLMNRRNADAETCASLSLCWLHLADTEILSRNEARRLFHLA